MRLVRAVARREPLPGYAIEAPPETGAGTGDPRAVGIVETWVGPRLAAHVVEIGADAFLGEAGFAARFDNVAAVWLAAPGTGPGGGRLAVAVTLSGRPGEPR